MDKKFKLLCKENSEKGWTKSTVCNLPNGCVMQITTQQGDNVGVNLNDDKEYDVIEQMQHTLEGGALLAELSSFE